MALSMVAASTRIDRSLATANVAALALVDRFYRAFKTKYPEYVIYSKCTHDRILRAPQIAGKQTTPALCYVVRPDQKSRPRWGQNSPACREEPPFLPNHISTLAALALSEKEYTMYAKKK